MGEKERQKRKNLRRRTLSKSIINDFTESDKIRILQRFNFSCSLTGHSEYQWDHVIPLSTGHGGTTYKNMIPLSQSLNASKRDRNIFEWFKESKEYLKMPLEKFNDLISYLATINGMTVDDYRNFVYAAHEKPKEINIIDSSDTFESNELNDEEWLDKVLLDIEEEYQRELRMGMHASYEDIEQHKK